VFEAEWKQGDRVCLSLDLPLRTEPRSRFIGDTEDTDYGLVSLWKGPRQLVYNQQHNQHLWRQRSARPALRDVYQVYGPLRFDKSFTETPLKIGDKVYEKGLGTHAVSEIVYALAGQFAEFQADVGIDASAKGEGAVRFKVCVDGVVKQAELVKASSGEDEKGQVQSSTLCGNRDGWHRRGQVATR